MTPLKNATDTVQDKTGATPDIANLPNKIKETVGNHAMILNNMIEDSGSSRMPSPLRRFRTSSTSTSSLK